MLLARRGDVYLQVGMRLKHTSLALNHRGSVELLKAKQLRVVARLVCVCLKLGMIWDLPAWLLIINEMKEKSTSVSEIINVVQDYYKGKSPKIICEERNLNRHTLDSWLEEYSQVATSFMDLQSENEKLKKLYNNLVLINQMLHETLDDLINKA